LIRNAMSMVGIVVDWAHKLSPRAVPDRLTVYRYTVY
jgi:hypothetical protein